MREQWQRPGLAGHLAHRQLDQPRLEPQPRQPGRLGHRPLELVLAHRPEQELVGGDRAGELGMRHELAVHVGPHPDRHRTPHRQQRIDEGLPAVRVLAQGEQLLELIDHHQLSRIVLDIDPRSSAGVTSTARSTTATSPARTAAMRPARSDRRLAAAGRAHHRHQPTGRQPLDQLADHRLPTEEIGAVLRLEREQAAIRALGRGKRGCDARAP